MSLSRYPIAASMCTSRTSFARKALQLYPCGSPFDVGTQSGASLLALPTKWPGLDGSLDRLSRLRGRNVDCVFFLHASRYTYMGNKSRADMLLVPDCCGESIDAKKVFRSFISDWQWHGHLVRYSNWYSKRIKKRNLMILINSIRGQFRLPRPKQALQIKYFAFIASAFFVPFWAVLAQ